MSEQFDAYHKWLGISPEKQPPNLYQLLGVDEFESDPDVLEAAADQRMAHLRTYQTSKHARLSQKLLNEISTARVTLLNPDKKADYDQQLQLKLAADADDPLGPSFNQLTGGTTLAGPASFASQPAPNPLGPVISTKPTIKKKPAWILPVGISVAAIVILGVVITVVIVAGSKKDEPEKTVAEQDAVKQPIELPNDPDFGQTPPENPKDDSSGGQSTSDLDGQQDSTKNNGETTSPFEPVEDPATKTETAAPDTATTTDASTNPVGPTEPIISETPKKHPLPIDAQQNPVLATLEETFKLSEKRTSDEQLDLAGELFKLAGQSLDPVEKFVLLRGTMKYAGEGGDAQLLLQAVESIDRDFEIDRLEIAQKALIGFAGLASTEKHFGSLAKATSQFIADAVSEDRVNLAQGLAQEVYNAAVKRSTAAAYRKQFYEQRKQVDELFAQWQQVQDAQAKLKSSPDDPDANLLVGKWKCFREGDWESGLPLLAKGGNEILSTLAKKELTSPSESVQDQIALGDTWWDAAQTAAADDKTQFLGRAYDWYSRAKQEATSSLDNVKLDRRLAEIGDLKRPVRAAKTVANLSRPINLLERIDLSKVYVSGKVQPTQSGIRFEADRRVSRMVIPASAKGNYVLDLEFTRVGSDPWAIGLIFPVGERHCTLCLSYLSGRSHGLGLIDGKPVESNGTAKTPGQLEQNRRYRLELAVTRKGDISQISALLDGVSIVQWQGKEALLSPQWVVKDESALPKGDFCWISVPSTVLHSAKLRAIPQSRVASATPSEGTDIGSKVPIAPKGADGLPQLVALQHFATEGRTPVGFLQGGRYGMRCRTPYTYIVDLATGMDVTKMKGSGMYITAAAISPNEQYIVVGYRRGEGPTVFSTASGQALHQLVGHEVADTLIADLDISPDGKTVVSSGGDGTVRLWELSTGKELHKLEVGEVAYARFLPDGRALIGHSRAVEIWDPKTGESEKVTTELESGLRSLAVSPSGVRFAIGLRDGEIKIFSFDKSWNVEREIKCPEWEGLTFSRDGQQILSAGGGSLALWDVATGKKLASAAHEDVAGVALSPDGKHALSASRKAAGAILWQLP